MINGDWDLFSIMHSCNATSLTPSSAISETSPHIQTTFKTSPHTLTTTTTNKIISLQNHTPHFDDFTLSYENNPDLFSMLKSNDFLPLENVIPNSNPTPTNPIRIPTTISSNTNISAIITPVTTNTTFTTPTLTTTIPTTTSASPIFTTIVNINTSINGTNHYPTILDFPIFIGQQQIKPNNNNQTIFPEPSANIEITTAHFDLAYNHPSVLREIQRKCNQLPIQVPQTSFGVMPNTLSRHPNRKFWKRKNNNVKILECHLSAEKIKEDPWTWRKYGEKIIKGSSHPRSYYKCSSFNVCSAKKIVEKSKTKENTYVVTYKGHHNHKEPKRKHKFDIDTFRNNSSKEGLSTAKIVESSSNVRNMDSSNVVITHFDQTENINTQILSTQSKVLYPKNELTKNHLLVSQEVVSSSNVGNLSSSNVMMLQFDEPKSSDAQVFTRESTIPYSQIKSIESCDDDDHHILIPNMRAMSEDILLDFNHLNGGRFFS
ncbi:probable WRKY transcription factor 14 [Lathyrus oleraceus]|nr:probable WRKY transcription factor 14 [Pisum sativum]